MKNKQNLQPNQNTLHTNMTIKTIAQKRTGNRKIAGKVDKSFVMQSFKDSVLSAARYGQDRDVSFRPSSLRTMPYSSAPVEPVQESQQEKAVLNKTVLEKIVLDKILLEKIVLDKVVLSNPVVYKK